MIAISMVTVSAFATPEGSGIGAFSGNTTVGGKIWASDSTTPVGGANVTVNCNSTMRYTTSLSDGAYSVDYNSIICPLSASVTVTAIKGSLSGSTTATVQSFPYITVNLAIADVTLTPEFGMITGMITLFGALGIFMYTRKK